MVQRVTDAKVSVCLRLFESYGHKPIDVVLLFTGLMITKR
jgi:hypothetical protein